MRHEIKTRSNADMIVSNTLTRHAHDQSMTVQPNDISNLAQITCIPGLESPMINTDADIL